MQTEQPEWTDSLGLAGPSLLLPRGRGWPQLRDSWGARTSPSLFGSAARGLPSALFSATCWVGVCPHGQQGWFPKVTLTQGVGLLQPGVCIKEALSLMYELNDLKSAFLLIKSLFLFFAYRTHLISS